MILHLIVALVLRQQPASTGQVNAAINNAKVTPIPALAKIPVMYAAVSTGNSSGGTAIYQQGILDNSDGTASGLNVSVPNVAQDTAEVDVQFYGTTFGVRFRHSSTTNFTVDIDREGAKRITDPGQFSTIEGLTGPINYEDSKVVRTGLDPWIIHVARLTWTQNTTTLITGFLVDAGSASATTLLRTSQAATPVVLSYMTSGVLNPALVAPYAMTSPSTSNTMNSIDQEVFSNFSASSVTVYVCKPALTVSTISNGNSSTAATIGTSSAHGLSDSSPVILSNLTGTVNAGTYAMTIPAFAKVSGYSTTTFGLYQDAALTVPIYCTGSYTSGGSEYTLIALFPVAAGGNAVFSFPRPVSLLGWSEFASGPGISRFISGGTYQ